MIIFSLVIFKRLESQCLKLIILVKVIGTGEFTFKLIYVHNWVNKKINKKNPSTGDGRSSP